MKKLCILGALLVIATSLKAEIIRNSSDDDRKYALDVFRDSKGLNHLYVINPSSNKRLSLDLAPTRKQIKTESKDISNFLSNLDIALGLLSHKSSGLNCEVIWYGRDARIWLHSHNFTFSFDIKYDTTEDAYFASSRS